MMPPNMDSCCKDTISGYSCQTDSETSNRLQFNFEYDMIEKTCKEVMVWLVLMTIPFM